MEVDKLSTPDEHLACLWQRSAGNDDRQLAARYAPIIRFDAREPFLPLAAGYTLFRRDGPSPSFRQGRGIRLAPPDQPPAALAIEYAIWWDWDIGHLYELEHVWIYVDEAGEVVRAEASWHGEHRDMRLEGALAREGDHVVLYSEPGKHAFAPTPEWFAQRRKRFKREETSDLAGLGGVLLAPYIQGEVAKTPYHDLLARSYLAQHAFSPSLDFSQVFTFEPQMLVPWPALRGWMPARVNRCLEEAQRQIPPGRYRFLRIGHRGAAAHAPDNTLAGIRRAAQLGADMVEMDLQRTRNGQIVLCHDAYLMGQGGEALPVGASTLAQLQRVDLGRGERVPTLAQAIKVMGEESLGAYMEIKDRGVLPGLIEAIRQNHLHSRCIFGSFRPDWLADLKAEVPEAATAILFSAVELDAVVLAGSIGASYVHPCWERYPSPSQLLSPRWIGRARGAGLGIVCWHEERPEEIVALRELGVDGICSDRPELLQRAWEDREPG